MTAMLEQQSPPAAPPGQPAPLSGLERSRAWSLVALGAVALLLVGAGLGFALGRVTALASSSAAPAAGEWEWDAWLPDCSAAPGPQCEAEVVVRRFMAAWQAGEPLGDFTTSTFRAPERAPRGPLSRAPRVAVAQSGLGASVTAYTESDGQFVLRLVQREDGWRVEAVQP